MPHPASPSPGNNGSSNRTTIWLAASIFIGVFLVVIGLQPGAATTATAQSFVQPVVSKKSLATTERPKPKPANTPKNKPAQAKPAANPPRNCTEARRRGIAPMHYGDPNYGEWMDGDGDGIACEPYHRR